MIEKEVEIRSYGSVFFHKNFDKTNPAYLEVLDYVELTYKPAINRVIEQIINLYRLTIENDSCVLRHVKRGNRDFIVVADAFIDYHLPKFIEYRRTIKEYYDILYNEIDRICKSYCKYGDARCCHKLYTCYCNSKSKCECGNCEFCCTDYDDSCIDCRYHYCKNDRFRLFTCDGLCAPCYLDKKRPDCNCSYYYYLNDRRNMLSFCHATRKQFVSIKFEVDGNQIFYFAFLVNKGYSNRGLWS